MKKILLLVLGVALFSAPVEAQSFLKKLGKAVENAVKEEITNAIKDGVNKNSQNDEQPQQSAQPAAQANQANQAYQANQASRASGINPQNR